MRKRMTLLAKRPELSTSDFRSYWAGPHARLALGMNGISRYVHNRVDNLLWSSSYPTAFSVDGVVELCFGSEEDMRLALQSRVAQRYIPADEPNFLHGWTLCLADEQQSVNPAAPGLHATKVLVLIVSSPVVNKNDFQAELASLALTAGAGFQMNWTVSTAQRETLWTEPNPPDAIASCWFVNVTAAYEAFDVAAPLGEYLKSNVDHAEAYLIDELVIL